MNPSRYTPQSTWQGWPQLGPELVAETKVVTAVGTASAGAIKVPDSLREDQGSRRTCRLFLVPVSDVLGTVGSRPALSDIKSLLEQSRVEEARELCWGRLQCDPLNPDLLRLMQLLQPAHVRPSSAVGVDHRAVADWIAKHHSQYRGQWVVLSRGTLVAADTSLASALARARETGQQDLLIHQIPNEDTER